MTAPAIIIGCGILEKEIRFLMAKNSWQGRPVFLPSGLHVDFNRLRDSLEQGLAKHANEQSTVFYGDCHPQMNQILENAHVIRTPGQNCVDIYLGHELFCRELELGAFFLFEDWALHWQQIIGGVMPGNPEIMRSIFRSAHKYLLAIRTPCSGDFTSEAEAISTMVDMELRWIDVGLEQLEQTLKATIEQATMRQQ